MGLARAKRGVGQPALAKRVVDKGCVEAFHGCRHCLARAYLERTVAPNPRRTHATRLLVLDDELLCPPLAEVVLAHEPVRDLAIRAACRAPGVQYNEPLLTASAGRSLHAIRCVAH